MDILRKMFTVLPRRLKRAALLRAIWDHNGGCDKDMLSKLSVKLELHENRLSIWLGDQMSDDIPDLPKELTVTSIKSWSKMIPSFMQYETPTLYLRDMVKGVQILTSGRS